MFDNLLILNRGKINYFGLARKSIQFYEKLGYDVENDKNPIDYFIDIAIKGSK